MKVIDRRKLNGGIKFGRISGRAVVSLIAICSGVWKIFRRWINFMCEICEERRDADTSGLPRRVCADVDQVAGEQRWKLGGGVGHEGWSALISSNYT